MTQPTRFACLALAFVLATCYGDASSADDEPDVTANAKSLFFPDAFVGWLPD